MEGGKGILVYHIAPWEKQQEHSCYSWVNLVQLFFPTGLMLRSESPLLSMEIAVMR